MSHSHLAIRHLVKKLDQSEQRPIVKAAVPAWLTSLIDSLAERFEPFSGVARVGYECVKTETGWELALFLGEHEQVGGSGDGELRAVNFRFDMAGVEAHFERVESIRWNVFPSSHVCFEDLADLSVVTIVGCCRGEQLRIQIHAAPPQGVGPAIREYTDGRMELV